VNWSNGGFIIHMTVVSAVFGVLKVFQKKFIYSKPNFFL